MDAGVYLLMRGNELLYVGYGTNVQHRAKKRDKGHESRWQAILRSTRVKVFKCRSVDAAKRLEEQIIRKHQPPFNIRRSFGPADLTHTRAIIESLPA